MLGQVHVGFVPTDVRRVDARVADELLGSLRIPCEIQGVNKFLHPVEEDRSLAVKPHDREAEGLV